MINILFIYCYRYIFKRCYIAHRISERIYRCFNAGASTNAKRFFTLLCSMFSCCKFGSTASADTSDMKFFDKLRLIRAVQLASASAFWIVFSGRSKTLMLVRLARGPTALILFLEAVSDTSSTHEESGSIISILFADILSVVSEVQL